MRPIHYHPFATPVKKLDFFWHILPSCAYEIHTSQTYSWNVHFVEYFKLRQNSFMLELELTYMSYDWIGITGLKYASGLNPV